MRDGGDLALRSAPAPGGFCYRRGGDKLITISVISHYYHDDDDDDYYYFMIRWLYLFKRFE